MMISEWIIKRLNQVSTYLHSYMDTLQLKQNPTLLVQNLGSLLISLYLR